jgi:hypothetical protein
MHHLRHLPLLLFLATLTAVTPAASNMAAPLRPGSALGEPQVALAGLVIERERLRIDLRPLAMEPASGGAESDGFGRALVSAVYDVRNDGAERPITLEFVAQALDTAQWSVTIDGRRIVAHYRAADEPLELRTTPSTTPGIDGAPLQYEAAAAGLLRFDALLAPGRHSIRVEYVAEATQQVVDHPLVHWQLGYLLEPAKRWPSFGTLDVAIIAPAGWSVATEPPLRRSGNVLSGRFEEIPADALTITARAAYAPWWPFILWVPSAIAFLLGSVGAWRLGRGLGRRLARNGRRAAWAFPAALGAGFVLAWAMLAVGVGCASIEESLIGAGQQSWGGYDFLYYLLVLPIAFITGTVLVQTAATQSIGRARRRYDARWIDNYPEHVDYARSPVNADGGIHRDQE